VVERVRGWGGMGRHIMQFPFRLKVHVMENKNSSATPSPLTVNIMFLIFQLFRSFPIFLCKIFLVLDMQTKATLKAKKI
jgi:hypothetical protein